MPIFDTGLTRYTSTPEQIQYLKTALVGKLIRLGPWTSGIVTHIETYRDFVLRTEAREMGRRDSHPDQVVVTLTVRGATSPQSHYLDMGYDVEVYYA